MYDQTEKSAKNPTGTFSVEISVILWGSYLSVNASKIYRCVWFWNIISMFNPFLEAKISSILIKSMIRRSKQASRITHWLKTMVLEHCLRRSFDCFNFSRFFREYFHVFFGCSSVLISLNTRLFSIKTKNKIQEILAHCDIDYIECI